jgi:hypothetical protein
MTHLTDGDLVDLLEGTLDSSRAAHARTCGACVARAEALERTRTLVARAEVPEPPPFFWSQFSARINEQIDAAPAGGSRRFLPWLAFAPLGALAIALVSFKLVAPLVLHQNDAALPAAVAVDQSLAPDVDDLDADADWAVVRAAAEGLDLEDAQSEGLAARPGTADRIAMELTQAEREELIRLVQEEIKAGA